MQALPGSLASLDLGSCGVEAEGAASLAAALAQSASVNTRPPGNNKAAARFLTNVFFFCAVLQALTALELSANAIGDDGTKC